MNIVKILKKLGFNPNIIEDKQLRIEFISLIEIFMDKYQLYGDVYDKGIYTGGAFEEYSEVKTNKIYSEKKDVQKKCKTIFAFDSLTNKEYDLDVIYDEISKSYTILFKPLTFEEFSHNLFGSSFFIKYDTVNKKMIASMISKNLECNLVVDRYEFNYSCDDSLLIVNNKSIYEGLSFILFERKYKEFFKTTNLNRMYKPGEMLYCKHLKLKSKTSTLSTNSKQNVKKIIVDNVNNKFENFILKNCVIVYNHGNDGYYKKYFLDTKPKRSLLLDMLVANNYYKKFCLNKQKIYNKH